MNDYSTLFDPNNIYDSMAIDKNGYHKRPWDGNGGTVPLEPPIDIYLTGNRWYNDTLETHINWVNAPIDINPYNPFTGYNMYYVSTYNNENNLADIRNIKSQIGKSIDQIEDATSVVANANLLITLNGPSGSASHDIAFAVIITDESGLIVGANFTELDYVHSY